MFPEGAYSPLNGPLNGPYALLRSLYQELRGRIYKRARGDVTYVRTDSGWTQVWPVLTSLDAVDVTGLRIYYERPPDYSIREGLTQDLGPCVEVLPGQPMKKKAQEILHRARQTTVWEYILNEP